MTSGEGGIPEWAASVNAFSSASQNSKLLSQASQLQFPDTSQLGGLCGQMLGGSAFTSGLVADGNPDTQGTAGALVGGSQNFADGLCGLMGGAGSNTSPQTVMDGATDVHGAVNSNPMASGTIAMAPDYPSGNSALDAVNGMQAFANSLYNILSACGCAGSNAPANVSPQQVITNAQDTADGVTANPMASGILAMGQDPSGTGNVALDAINGATTFFNTLFGILSFCGCGSANSPSEATPQQVITTAQDSADAINNSPMASGIIAMGQDPSGSGNVAVDAVNGSQNFANSLFNILTLCGCAKPSGSGPLSRMLGGPYTATNVSPQDVIDVAQAVSDAVTANPFAADLLGVGTGNIAIDALTSGQSLTDSVHTAVAGALTTNHSLNDVVTAGGQAINQNTANHVSNQAVSSAQSVVLKQDNFLVSNDFSSPYTVVGDSDWSHDATDGPPGTQGCLAYTGNGALSENTSSEIAVVAGETIEVACEIKTVALAYTGINPISFGVQKYRKMKTASGQTTYADVGGVHIVTLATPVANMDWTGFAGSYVVEPGVDQLRFLDSVGAGKTGGTVKFGAAVFLKLDLIADDAVPGVGLTTDSIVTQLYGSAGSGFTHNQEAVALANTAASLASVTAKAAALSAEGSTGAIAGDDFNWTGTLPDSTHWGGAYSYTTSSSLGTYQANGTDATFHQTPPGLGGGSEDFHFNWAGTDAISTTDYQLVQLVLDSPPGYDSFTAGGAYLYVFGRVSSDWLNYIKLKIGGDGTYQVIRSVSGTETVMDSGSCPVPGAGAIVSLYCGDKTSSAPRHFKAQIGSTDISSFTESGTSSLVGSSYRGWGFGGYYNSFEHGAAPPDVNQWLAQDQ